MNGVGLCYVFFSLLSSPFIRDAGEKPCTLSYSSRPLRSSMRDGIDTIFQFD